MQIDDSLHEQRETRKTSEEVRTDDRVVALEARLAELERSRRRHGWRSRWAAIGAAVAVTLGAGAVIQRVTASSSAAPSSFVAVTPFRILDSRPAPANVGGWVGPLAPNSSHTFAVAGEGSVPDDALAVVMNVTAVDPTGNSYLTVYPAGDTLPWVSNVNFRAGNNTANLVTVALGTNGEVTVYNFTGSVHVIADVAGYYRKGNDNFISLAVPSDASTLDGNVAYFSDTLDDWVQYATVMPPDYVTGDPFTAVLYWQYNGGVACNVDLDFVDGWEYRPGLEEWSYLSGTGGGAVAADTTGKVMGTEFTITPTGVGSQLLQAGDLVVFTFERDGDGVADTCTTWMKAHALAIYF